MRVLKYLFEHYLNPLIVVLITSIIIGGGSKYKTGDWSKWMLSIPKTFWVVFLSIILLWIIVIAARKRLNRLRNDKYSTFIYAHPYYGWEDIDEISYAGVIWRVQVPRDPMEIFRKESIDPSDINIDTPPRCPKCKTEIEQKPNLLWGYIWKCVNCDFKKRSKFSFYQEKNRVEKIAKRRIEIIKSNSSDV